MKTKMLCSMIVLVLCCVVPMANAATVFTGDVDNDFNNAANWDIGLLPGNAGPNLGTGGDAVINASATLTANFVQLNGADDGFTLFIGLNSTGDLTLPADMALYPVNGADTGDLDTFIGAGDGGFGTFNIAGTYTAIGAGADMFIGGQAGGYGVVNVLDGGNMDIRKAVEIINGKLIIGAAASMGTGLQDKLIVDNGGTLAFILGEPDMIIPRYHGKTLVLELGSTSTLELTPVGNYEIGDSWLLIDDISSFTGVDGGDGTGVFGSVINQDGMQFDVTYDTTAKTLSATLTSLAVRANSPEPANGMTGVEIDLSTETVAGELSWKAPAYAGATYDIYIGTTEPNASDANYGLTKLNATPQTATSIAPQQPLDNLTAYYWVVDAYEPNEMSTTFHAGSAWTFTTVTSIPVITMQPQNETGEFMDMFVEAKNAEVYQWYQVGSPDVLVQTTGTMGTPGSASDIFSTGVEGYYYCVVSNTVDSAISDIVRAMTPRMVAQWTLDGTLAAIEGNPAENWDGDYIDSNSLAPNPDDSTVVYVTGADGTVNGAVDFDGEQMIEIPGSSAFFNFQQQGVTLTAWVLNDPEQNAAYRRTVTKGGSYGIAQGGIPGTIACIVSGSGWRTVVPASENTELEWRFVAITYDAATETRVAYGIYDDDDVVAVLHSEIETPFTPGEGVLEANVRIGGMDLNNHFGAVDDVRIYNYALTSEDIQAVYGEMATGQLCLDIEDPSIAPYDFNNDCQVTLEDFAMFAASWLNSQLVNL